MKLLSLRIESWKGIAKRELALTPGVNLIVGPNEVGKSTVAEALRLLFDPSVKSSSKKDEIKAAQPAGRDVGPEVEVELEAGAVRLRFLKRFLRKPATELRVLAPRAEQLTGDEAHQRFRELLEEHLDEALFRALWIEQGEKLRFDAKQGAGRWLSAALDRAAGASADAESAVQGDLLSRAERERRRYYTLEKGQETDELASASSAAIRAGDALAQLREEHARLERAVARHAELDRAISAARAALPQLLADAEGAERARDAARGRRAERDAQERRVVELLARESASREELARRESDQLRVRALESQLASTSASVEALRERAAELERARTAALDAQARARSAHELSHARVQALEVDRRGLQAELEKLRLAEQLFELQRLARRVDELRATARPELSEELFTKLRSALAAREGLLARRAGAAPAIELRALRALELRWEGAQRSLAAGEALEARATRDLEVELPGLARFAVRVEHLGAETREKLARAEEEIRSLSAALGVREAAEAEELRARLLRARAELEQVQHALRTRLAARKGAPSAGEAEAGLRAELDALERTIADWRRTRDAALPLAVDLSSAEVELATAARARDERLAELSARELELREAERRAAQLAQESARQSGVVEATRLELSKAEAALAEARARKSDDDLRRVLVEARDAHQLAELALERSKAELALLDPEMLEKLAKKAREACEQKRKDMDAASLERASCAGALESAGGRGVGELVEGAEALAAETAAELARTLRRARAAKRLHEALLEQRDASAAARRRPLEQRIARLGRHVFGPSFDVELDEDLHLATCTRDGVRLPLELLSFGTQEQLDLLLRLAVAESVAEHGGVPLLFDDTLGSADPERTRALARLLALAGERLQILVLTCHPERFDALGSAHRIELARAPREESA
ncbi:MAG: AAA family ATPase [Planctomycetes bacterium]|nr:AAA family ATPase [Planctomycetota bacterium]